MRNFLQFFFLSTIINHGESDVNDKLVYNVIILGVLGLFYEKRGKI